MENEGLAAQVVMPAPLESPTMTKREQSHQKVAAELLAARPESLALAIPKLFKAKS